MNGRRSDWLAPLGVGIAVCLLTAMLLSLAVRYFLPSLTDHDPNSVDAEPHRGVLCGVAIWAISIGLGTWQTLRRRLGKSSV